MARIRTIKPDAFTSESLSSVPAAVRWTFAGLWTYVDDDGRGRADVRLIKAALYPLDDSTSVADIESHLRQLEQIGAVCRYMAGGKQYLHVVEFVTHQRINRKSNSSLPACSRTTHDPLSEHSVSPQGPRNEGVPQEVEVEVEVEVERERDTPTVPPTSGGALALREPESQNQRAQRLTKVYTDEVPLSRFPAVMGVVKKAIHAGKTDDEITSALLRLAMEGRSVTTETLRVEIEGLPTAHGGSARKREGDRILREAWEASA